jgi:hypothetical protein
MTGAAHDGGELSPPSTGRDASGSTAPLKTDGADPSHARDAAGELAGSCTSSPVFADNFSASIAPGAGYTFVGGSWTRGANALTATYPGGVAGERAYALLSGDFGDFDVTLDAHSIGGDGFGIAYATTGDGSGYAILVHPNEFHGVYIKQLIAGAADENLASVTLPTVAPDASFTLHVTRSSGNVAVTLSSSALPSDVTLSAVDGGAAVHGPLGLVLSLTSNLEGAVFDDFILNRATCTGADGGTLDSGAREGGVTDGGVSDGGGSSDAGGRGGDSAAVSSLIYGANVHPYADYGSAAPSAVNTQFSLMQDRKLVKARVDLAPVSSAAATAQTYVTAGASNGISLSVMLGIDAVCTSDGHTFTTNDATTIYNDTYQAVLSYVTPLRDSVTDFEMGNELDLTAGQGQSPGGWNEGWVASDWQNISAYGSPDYFANWASAVKGAADALAAINTQYGTHLRRILNTTGTHVGFLDFMSQSGVDYDVISYHYYYLLGTSPYALAAQQPGSSSNTWDVFAGLGAYGHPVTINEMNCAEIYDSNFQNTATDPLYATCLTNVRSQLGYFETQTEMDLESVYVYELLDEPSQAAPENHFGLFWNDPVGDYTPKANLYLWSAFAGGALSSSEEATLSSFGLLPLP